MNLKELGEWMQNIPDIVKVLVLMASFGGIWAIIKVLQAQEQVNMVFHTMGIGIPHKTVVK